jgi:hypothetical protein
VADEILRRAQSRHLEELVTRLHVSMAATEREAMGLHAALVEAIRRLHVLDQPIDDLKLVLDNPGSAPLNWRGGNPRPTRIRSREEWSNEYERIFGQDQ